MKSNNEKLHIQTDLSDYRDNNHHDCLTDAFERLLWCIKIVLLSFWKVLLFTKEELGYTRNEMISSKDILSMNNSAGGDYPYRKLPRHRNRLPKKNSQLLREESSSKLNTLSNKARVTVRSISNQNLNRADSNHASSTPSNTLGISNSHITVTPVNSSHCQNRKLTENINLREQLADALCRRPYEPLIFINRGGICCGHCRPLIFPNVPFHHSCHNFPLINPQRELNQDKEQSPQLGDASDTQSTPYSITPNIQSQSIDEPLSTGTISNNEQNQSILSFPEHDTPLSQKSERLVDDDTQLKLNAQILVNDSIENAQKKYQKDLQNNTLATIKQIIKNKSKSASVPDANVLCHELCNKLNLSDSNQIAEIMRLLASNAPHILKEQPPTNTSNIENHNNMCSQLLLHPPFKPKRLIQLCPDGSIQVLSAVDDDDDNSNQNQINNPQQYRLNYSNSAVIPSIQHNSVLDESSLACMFINEQSLEQEKTLLKYQNSLLTLTQDIPDPIVKINLDLNDEDDDENSLPEIFFKRIIVPEFPINDDKIEVNRIRRR